MNNNMHINGTGTITGGEYNEVSIAGMGKIFGDLSSNILDISGTCGGEGILTSNDIKVNGHMKYRGAVRCNNYLSVNGNMKVTENLSCKEVKVAGNLSIDGNCDFENANIMGAFNIKGNCEGNEFLCNGAVKIDGLLNADKIDIYLYKGAFIKDLGGSNIRVRAEEKMLKIPIVTKLFGNELTCDVIEGDNIYLENTKARKVSGNNIIIGRGCTIEEVEYKCTLEADENSIISKKVYVGKVNLIE